MYIYIYTYTIKIKSIHIYIYTCNIYVYIYIKQKTRPLRFSQNYLSPITKNCIEFCFSPCLSYIDLYQFQ